MANIGIVIPVKTGIQTCLCENREPIEKSWIPRIQCGAGPVCTGMTGKRTRMGKVDFKGRVVESALFREKRGCQPIHEPVK